MDLSVYFVWFSLYWLLLIILTEGDILSFWETEEMLDKDKEEEDEQFEDREVDEGEDDDLHQNNQVIEKNIFFAR